jgi:hypothetical protein
MAQYKIAITPSSVYAYHLGFHPFNAIIFVIFKALLEKPFFRLKNKVYPMQIKHFSANTLYR